MDDRNNVKKLFKKFNISGGYYVTGNDIYKYQKKIMGDNLIKLDNICSSLIKLNNKCNYFTFRKHIHDIKSYINGMYGMVSLLMFEDEDNNKEDNINESFDENKEYYKEINSMMNKLIKFTTNEIQSQETHFQELSNYSLKDLIIYYIPTHCSTFIVDKRLDTKVNKNLNVIKHILDIVEKIKGKDIVFEYNNNKVNIISIESGNKVATIKIETLSKT